MPQGACPSPDLLGLGGRFRSQRVVYGEDSEGVRFKALATRPGGGEPEKRHAVRPARNGEGQRRARGKLSEKAFEFVVPNGAFPGRFRQEQLSFLRSDAARSFSIFGASGYLVGISL